MLISTDKTTQCHNTEDHKTLRMKCSMILIKINLKHINHSKSNKIRVVTSLLIK
jgi:hypothetical protein